MFLKLQFDGRLDAVAGVVVGLFKSKIHQVFVIRSGHISTDEYDDICQDLEKHKTKSVQETFETLKVSLKYPFC